GFVPHRLHAVKSGDEAIAYLKGTGIYADRVKYPLPHLVLLDIKMPGTDGLQVLRWIRQEPGLSLLRVVVLTGSDQIRDVNQAYKLGANSFMVKPSDFENFIEMGKTLQSYWLSQSKAPEAFRTEPIHDPGLPPQPS